MIYLYDDKGTITAEYEDWKLRDVELDIHNGSLSGAVLQADDIRHFKFADGRYVEKSVDEKYAEKLITEKERDDSVALASATAREALIQEKIRAMAEAELAKEGVKEELEKVDKESISIMRSIVLSIIDNAKIASQDVDRLRSLETEAADIGKRAAPLQEGGR